MRDTSLSPFGFDRNQPHLDLFGVAHARSAAAIIDHLKERPLLAERFRERAQEYARSHGVTFGAAAEILLGQAASAFQRSSAQDSTSRDTEQEEDR